MQRLNPDKLSVKYPDNNYAGNSTFPRYYTLTHSDRTGNLFLTIGREYDRKQVSSLYTRLMRDEILAELVRDGDNIALHVYCHVSGGIVLGGAGWRYRIFQTELPLVIEAIRYGDRALFETFPGINQTQVIVHFVSHKPKYNKTEDWGELNKYA
jgi:magnesium dechelatase